MSATTGSGRFISWTGACLFIGENVAPIPEHAHYAIQIAFGATHGIRFQTHDIWIEYGGAMMPSRQPHSMDATGVGLSAVLLIEPETPQGRALTRRYLQNGIAAIPEEILAVHVPLMFEAYRASNASAVLENACHELIESLTDNTERLVVVDPRISRAIEFINANLNVSLTLEDVASEACLSPSRFRHVFVEATGMALRPYILWRRFVHVWELLSAGGSLSTAAHAAGFADAAHLTRTSRSMFGFPPSALQIVRQSSSQIVPITHARSRIPITPTFRVQPLRARMNF
ncbi:MAG: AraC family transcriptional regulator [Gemmatimonadaceae bacterium]